MFGHSNESFSFSDDRDTKHNKAYLMTSLTTPLNIVGIVNAAQLSQILLTIDFVNDKMLDF